MNRKRILFLGLLILALIVAIVVICVQNKGNQGSNESIDASPKTEAVQNENASDILPGENAGESGNIDISAETTPLTEEEEKVRTYFEENGEIISVVPVKQSKDVLSEAEAAAAFEKRGFLQSLQYSFTMEGEYLGPTDAGRSSEKYPMYQSWYVAGDENVWLLYCINGSFIAFPAFYGSEEDAAAVPILFTETDGMWSYDGNNRFYLTRPNGNEAIMIQIDAINAETLDGLTKEVIDSLCAQK